MGLLSDKVALITGSSRGIGAEIAKVFGKNGAKVVVNYLRNKALAEGVVEEIKDFGTKAIAIKADVRLWDEVEEMVGMAVKEMGQIDILVNNASTPIDVKPFMETPWEDVQRKIDEYIKSAFHCSKAVAKGMMERRWGRIINILAALMDNSFWGFTAYSTAKGGLYSLSKQMALELGPYGIKVNMIAPGIVRTDMTLQFSEEVFRAIEEETPLGRIASTEDIAKGALFLASDLSDFVTGLYLPLDGGNEKVGKIMRLARALKDDAEEIKKIKYQ